MEVTIMVSLGGLDVAYGANTQITRTTVLCCATNTTTTQAQADIVHTLAAEKFPAPLRPDYTCFLRANKAAGYATALTHQVENGILKDLTKVPVAGARFQAADATKNRMPSIEAILSVGAVVPAVGDTAAVDTLFDETATTGMSIDELTTGASLQSQLMASQMAYQAGSIAGQVLGVAGNAGVQTLDYSTILDDSQFDGFTELATGDLTVTTASSSSALMDDIGAQSIILSVVALTTLR